MPVLSQPTKQMRELEECIIDKWYWFSHYAYTHDCANSRIAKYPCWPYLKNYVEQLDIPGDILVEKSRAMMVTWTTALYCLYCMLFRPGWSGLVVSRREAEVDDGGEFSTVDSIFGMIRFAYEALPPWMSGQLRFSHLKIINMEEGMNSYLTGESANVNSGRGKSPTFKWGDEFAVIPRSSEVHASMAAGNYRTLVYTSTPNFMGNEFARLRHDPRSGFRIVTLPWSLHPHRDADWYKKESQNLTEIQRAKELDIQYEFTSDSRVYNQFQFEVHVWPLETMPATGGEIYITFDEGIAHPGAMYVCRYKDGRLYILNEKYETGVHIQLSPAEKGNGVVDWIDVAESFEARYGKCKRLIIGQESRAAEDAFAYAGFKVWRAGTQPILRIGYVSRLLSLDSNGKPRLIISDRCENLLWEIPRYEWKKVGGLIIERPKAGNDHGCNAIETLAEYLQQCTVENEQEEKVWTSKLNWEQAKHKW